jgi:hypothetical protein
MRAGTASPHPSLKRLSPSLLPQIPLPGIVTSRQSSSPLSLLSAILRGGFDQQEGVAARAQVNPRMPGLQKEYPLDHSPTRLLSAVPGSFAKQRRARLLQKGVQIVALRFGK